MPQLTAGLRAVMVLEPQGEVCWTVPAGAPGGVLLFETTSAHMHNNTLTLLGGLQGWSLAFRVRFSYKSLGTSVCVCVCR